MKTLMKSLLVALGGGVLLAGCASYDYGYGYSYTEPYYYGYNSGYAYSPYYYDYGGPYYGPSYYVGPSVGFGFTYRDRDYHYDRGHRYDRSDRYRARNHRGSRNSSGNASTRPTVTQPAPRNVAPANSRARPVAPPPTQASRDPWGGTNNPYARNTQQ